MDRDGGRLTDWLINRSARLEARWSGGDSSGDQQEGPTSAVYGASAGVALRRYVLKYATFTGRAGRAEYWWPWLVTAVINIAIGVATAAVAALLGPMPFAQIYGSPTLAMLVPGYLWGLLTALPSLTVSVRRLHDVNRRGWWSLLGLPLVLWGIAADLNAIGRPSPPTGMLDALGAVAILVAVPLLILHLLPPRPAGRRFDRASAGRPIDHRPS